MRSVSNMQSWLAAAACNQLPFPPGCRRYPEFCATIEAAANQLERWGFFIAGPARQHYLDVLAQAAVERKRQQEKENSEERER